MPKRTNSWCAISRPRSKVDCVRSNSRPRPWSWRRSEIPAGTRGKSGCGWGAPMCSTSEMISDNFRAFSSSRIRGAIAAVAVLALGSTALVVGGASVGAVTTPGAAYADFASPVGANPSWTSSLSMPGAPGFPSATIATNSLSPSTPGGTTTWLSASTPFGAQFASSKNQKYFSFSPTTGQAPSTTTITFATPTPANGWGFALGDVDAESIGVSATGANGSPVAVSELGFQHSTFAISLRRSRRSVVVLLRSMLQLGFQALTAVCSREM